MTPLPTTKIGRIYAAIRDGCETVGDIEIALDFTLRRAVIGAHITQLKNRGLVVKVGTKTEQHTCIRLGKEQVAGYRASRFHPTTTTTTTTTTEEAV